MHHLNIGFLICADAEMPDCYTDNLDVNTAPGDIEDVPEMQEEDDDE